MKIIWAMEHWTHFNRGYVPNPDKPELKIEIGIMGIISLVSFFDSHCTKGYIGFNCQV